MKRARTVLILLPLLSFSALANDAVIRCTDGQNVSYQWARCEARATEHVVSVPDNEAPAAAANSAAASAATSASTANTQPAEAQLVRASWRQQVKSPTPYVGISDDAVLNMRGWGRPTKITRLRENRAWLEVWSYVAASGEARTLHFTNGRLTAKEFTPAPYLVQLANVNEAPQR